MPRWRTKPSSLIVLGSVIFVMLLIVVLPDVDLLDTAFQRGTAPIVLHTRGTSAPATANILAPLHIPNNAAEAFSQFLHLKPFAIYSSPNFLPILIRSIRR